MFSTKLLLTAVLAGAALAVPNPAPEKDCTTTKTLFPGWQATSTSYTHTETVCVKVDCHGCKNIAVISNGGIVGGLPPKTTVTVHGTGTWTTYACQPTPSKA